MRKTGTRGGWAVAAWVGGVAWVALASGCREEPGPPIAVESGGDTIYASAGDEASAVGAAAGVAAPFPAAVAQGDGESPAGGHAGPPARSDSTFENEADAGEGWAEDAAPPPEEVAVLPGARIATTADWAVSAQDHVAGDPVSVTVSEDYAPEGGPVLIPRGAKLLGRVRVAEAAQGPGETPFLEVGFETLSASEYERPVETLIVETGPAADQAVAQPGTIAEGAVVVVEIRRLVRLPPASSAPPSSSSTPPASQAGRRSLRSCRPFRRGGFRSCSTTG